MTINGNHYLVLGEKKIDGMDRLEITLRKPNGKKLYHVVRYEDGSISGVV